MLDKHDSVEDYLYAVNGRLAKGEREYGDTGFSKPASALAFEICEEAEDIAGWGYLLWRRAIALRRKAIALEAEIADLEKRRDALKARICGSS